MPTSKLTHGIGSYEDQLKDKFVLKGGTADNAGSGQGCLLSSFQSR